MRIRLIFWNASQSPAQKLPGISDSLLEVGRILDTEPVQSYVLSFARPRNAESSVRVWLKESRLWREVYRPINENYSKNNSYYLLKLSVCQTSHWVLYELPHFCFCSKCDWWALARRDEFWAQRRICWLCGEFRKSGSWWGGRSSLDLGRSYSNMKVWRNLVHSGHYRVE